MTDDKLPDAMILLLLHGATRGDGFCYPYPIISRPQAGDRKRRTAAELDAAAEGLIRRGYLKRTKTGLQKHYTKV